MYSRSFGGENMRSICIFIGICFVGVILFGNIFLAPPLLEYAENKVKSIASLAVSEAIEESLLECDYDNLYTLEKDNENNISYVKSNALEINRISNMVSTSVITKLQSQISAGITVNTGSAISAITAGMGPDVTVYVQPTGTAGTDFVSDFQTGGVNQTRHRLYLKFTADMYAALGFMSKKFTVSDMVLISENIIVGVTPEYFVDVNNEEDMLNLLP